MLMIAMNVHGDSDSTAAFKAMNNDAPLTDPRGFDKSREVVKARRSVEKTVDGDSAPAEKSVDDEVEVDDDVALTFPQRVSYLICLCARFIFFCVVVNHSSIHCVQQIWYAVCTRSSTWRQSL